jgi:hypothetical protein
MNKKNKACALRGKLFILNGSGNDVVDVVAIIVDVMSIDLSKSCMLCLDTSVSDTYSLSHCMPYSVLLRGACCLY